MSKTLMHLSSINFSNITLDTFFFGFPSSVNSTISFREKKECFSHIFYTWHLIFSVDDHLFFSYKKRYSY